jgi:hypothetical protein
MSNYENAAATKLLATSCCACGRPLLDAASVVAGMGPDCRQKYGVGSLDEETRMQANAHIYQIALHQEGPEVAKLLSSLRELGLDSLADRIVKRLARRYHAVVTTGSESFTVKASYDVAMAANLGRISGRRWDAANKVNVFPLAAKRAVWEALKSAFPGATCLGPHGEFQL